MQAFMLSLSSCMEHPTASMLRQQMLSRLMAVAAEGSSSAWLREWYERQSSLVASEEIMEAGEKRISLGWGVLGGGCWVGRDGGV